ncbi:M23 family metallopeptidase [Marinisporobacter balticus]|uniref:Murein DD-endopeptidase MepM/ murein hydrolase activator NlpD n=1 Tax=Marinisporobacter balticus TaxID=2018667 RepID=A0A4R2LFB0_9FIRM|nr:M23 family metallopeptidase [Marinisporobacter balticus]TCO77945.1 murein DD-endopeptidase MepM/ murein hydrolase activator NlpD [Marinisporobacter balticus]
MKADGSLEEIKKGFFKYYEKLNKDGKGKIYIGLIAAVILIGISTFAYSYQAAYTVKIDNTVVGIVRDKEDFTNIVESMQKRLRAKYNTDVLFHDAIDFERTRATDEELSKPAQIGKILQKKLNIKVKGYGIKADKKIITAVTTKAEANKVLEEIKKNYIDEEKNFEKIYFVENVVVEEVEEDINNLKIEQDAVKIILQGTEEEKIHEVQQGESFWTIAKKYKLNVDDLLKANPDVSPDKLQIDQKISLVVPKPLLTVATVEKVNYEEKIPYEIEFEETSALYKGEKKIKVNGKDGQREILAEVVKYNGIEFSKNILEESIIENPTKQVVLKGTKNPPPKKGTGTLDNPTRGRLSSRFGWRWGRKHTGIDLAGPIGTPIKAADGGKIIFSGYKNGYGKCLIIDHGANTQTYYAHCSKLLVSKGQNVFKGQKIAEVGNTGRSTGPHLHFEVRKNGVPVNPLNYVRY